MIKAVVTDIEGTTSSLSFVKDVLFPYSRARMRAFIHHHGQEPAVRAQLDEACNLVGRRLDEEALAAQLIQWIDEDRKLTPLKALQGMIWEEGFRRGDFTGHIYDDALRRLREWRQRGLRLYVFSSGSVQAQRLLFGYSDHGDLMPLFSGYFDTTIGAKRDPAAYERIAAAAGAAPAEMMFLSDIKEELDAARAAGMRTTWIVRDGEIDPAAAHPQARNFDAVEV
jgi:enolase-phosphatase E1